MMTDDKLMAAVIRKGVEFKIKSGALTEEHAKKILEPLDRMEE